MVMVSRAFKWSTLTLKWEFDFLLAPWFAFNGHLAKRNAEDVGDVCTFEISVQKQNVLPSKLLKTSDTLISEKMEWLIDNVRHCFYKKIVAILIHSDNDKKQWQTL